MKVLLLCGLSLNPSVDSQLCSAYYQKDWFYAHAGKQVRGIDSSTVAGAGVTFRTHGDTFARARVGGSYLNNPDRSLLIGNWQFDLSGEAGQRFSSWEFFSGWRHLSNGTGTKTGNYGEDYVFFGFSADIE